MLYYDDKCNEKSLFMVYGRIDFAKILVYLSFDKILKQKSVYYSAHLIPIEWWIDIDCNIFGIIKIFRLG